MSGFAKKRKVTVPSPPLLIMQGRLLCRGGGGGVRCFMCSWVSADLLGGPRTRSTSGRGRVPPPYPHRCIVQCVGRAQTDTHTLHGPCLWRGCGLPSDPMERYKSTSDCNVRTCGVDHINTFLHFSGGFRFWVCRHSDGGWWTCLRGRVAAVCLWREVSAQSGTPRPLVSSPQVLFSWSGRFYSSGQRGRGGYPRDALEGQGPQRWPQQRLGRRLEEVA